MLELYNNIKKRRLELGMTQAELGAKAGYSDNSMIAKIEKGKVNLPQSKIEEFAKALHTTAPKLMGYEGVVQEYREGFLPVYGSVCAGNGIYADDNIEDWIETGARKYLSNTHFALRIKGDSMEPELHTNDIVIVKKQDVAENNEIVIALVNGDEGVCKQLKKYEGGMALVSLNPNYPPRYFSEEEVTGIPVQIIGKVVETRRTYA